MVFEATLVTGVGNIGSGDQGGSNGATGALASEVTYNLRASEPPG